MSAFSTSTVNLFVLFLTIQLHILLHIIIIDPLSRFLVARGKINPQKEKKNQTNKPHFCRHFYSIVNETVLRLFYHFALNYMPLPILLKEEKGWLLITVLALGT